MADVITVEEALYLTPSLIPVKVIFESGCYQRKQVQSVKTADSSAKGVKGIKSAEYNDTSAF